MKLSILLHTKDYRGDHSADVCIAHEPMHEETVEHLAERLLKLSAWNAGYPDYSEYLVIRKIADTGKEVS